MQKFFGDIISTSNLGSNVGSITVAKLSAWQYLFSKHSDNAPHARNDMSTLENFGKLNDNVKGEIVQLTDNSATDSRIEKFCTDMANTQGFTAFLNDVDNFYIIESFLGYRKDYTSEKYEEIEEDFDFITDLTIKEKVIDWHNHAVTASRRKGKYAEGKEFENWVTIHLGSSESPTYKALKTAFATDGWNLDDYSIYRQVQMCINGQTTCNGKKDYFIADFVFVKVLYNPISQKDELDVKIADTKLSTSTGFTKNQNNSKLQSTLFIKSDNPNRIKGSSILLFNRPNFFTNSKVIYKIYSEGTTTSYGGVTK